MALLHALALLLAPVAIAVSWSRWDLAALIVIAALTVIGGITQIDTDAARTYSSGSFLGLMLAAIMLGAGPAAVLGACSALIAGRRRREPAHYLRNRVATYTWFPLIGALFFHAIVQASRITAHDLAYFALVLAMFMLALVVNFVGIAGYRCYVERGSISRELRQALLPALPAEMLSAALTITAVAIAGALGTIGIASFGLVLVILQYLLGELLRSKRRGEELHRKATVDELSGLANRERFHNLVDEMIEAARRTSAGFGVILIDLDHFKEVNDTLGHDYGDALLKELGPRLAACVGANGMVARMGGDEFGVLPGICTDDPERLSEIAGELLACIRRPFVAEELSIEVDASIGIARFPRDGEDVQTLVRRADVAMYAAKDAQSGHKLYVSEQDQHSLQQLAVLSDVRKGLAADQIVVHYQPIIDLRSGKVAGAEALARWEHPELGLLGPGAFIPIVEQTGLIGPLTRHILDRSIAQCAAWRRRGLELSVSVNLSVRNLLDRTLAEEIAAMLAAYNLSPQALKLEITESTIMSDVDLVLETLHVLCDSGMRISVDDFGTGYSSLANLRRLPIDELKIDRSFVSPMLQNDSDLIIVRSTINLGHDLGLRMVAEGVEDQATLDHLAAMGCDLAQGFHLSRPIPAEQFTAWAEQRSVAARA